MEEAINLLLPKEAPQDSQGSKEVVMSILDNVVDQISEKLKYFLHVLKKKWRQTFLTFLTINKFRLNQFIIWCTCDDAVLTFLPFLFFFFLPIE